ncbi:MAG: hypothetical protein D6715_14600 [Calditrichaeota bacterium]|nr:MAG: hypothetical protein D6715_14600 [Calditrichota bacterium]
MRGPVRGAYFGDVRAGEKKHRRLVGRRYEDFLRNGIGLELSPEEQVWRALFSDPRYQASLDRRRRIRRRDEQPAQGPQALFRSQTAALLDIPIQDNLFE